MQPFEMIAAPFEVWIAPEGEPFPAPAAAPAGNWVQLGTSGIKSMHADGVTVSHPQTIERDAFRTLGTTGARKASRTSEDLIIEFTLVDVTLEQYAEALAVGEYSEGGVVAVEADVGTWNMGLYRGLDIIVLSLLVRGPSPYDEDENMQYEVRRVYQDGEPSPVYSKSGPAGLAFRYIALVDSLGVDEGISQHFGRLRAVYDVTDVNLLSLTENLTAAFVPVLTEGVYAYALAATNPEEEVILVATLAGATITYDPLGVPEVVPSGVGHAEALIVGVNTITIRVEKAGFNTQDYTLTVTRAA